MSNNRGPQRHLPLSNVSVPPRPPTSQSDRRDTNYTSTQVPSPVTPSPSLSAVAYTAQSPQPSRSGTISSTYTAQRVMHNSVNSSAYVANTTQSQVTTGTSYPNVVPPLQQINNHVAVPQITEIAINESTTTTTSEMKISKEELLILEDSMEEITQLATTEIVNSIKIGGSTTDASRKNVSEHFLENVFGLLHTDLDKWKKNFLYPAVDEWVKKNVRGHIIQATKKTIERPVRGMRRKSLLSKGGTSKRCETTKRSILPLLRQLGERTR